VINISQYSAIGSYPWTTQAIHTITTYCPTICFNIINRTTFYSKLYLLFRLSNWNLHAFPTHPTRSWPIYPKIMPEELSTHPPGKCYCNWKLFPESLRLSEAYLSYCTVAEEFERIEPMTAVQKNRLTQETCNYCICIYQWVSLVISADNTTQAQIYPNVERQFSLPLLLIIGWFNEDFETTQNIYRRKTEWLWIINWKV